MLDHILAPSVVAPSTTKHHAVREVPRCGARDGVRVRRLCPLGGPAAAEGRARRRLQEVAEQGVRRAVLGDVPQARHRLLGGQAQRARRLQCATRSDVDTRRKWKCQGEHGRHRRRAGQGLPQRPGGPPGRVPPQENRLLPELAFHQAEPVRPEQRPDGQGVRFGSRRWRRRRREERERVGVDPRGGGADEGHAHGAGPGGAGRPRR